MAAENGNYGAPYDEKEQRKKIKEEKKQLRAEEKASKKEQKAKRKALADREADLDADDVGSGFAAFVITILIILMWLAIMALLIRLDIGGFGSQVLAPVLGKVPVVNRILPEGSIPPEGSDDEGGGSVSGQASRTQSGDGTLPEITFPGLNPGEDNGSGDGSEEGQGGSSDAYVRQLEGELAQAQQRNNEYAKTIAEQQAELSRLQPFEQEQAEFERVKADFYENVIYSDNGPGPEEYAKYYEGLNPELAAELYAQAIQSRLDTEEVQNYAKTYSAMKAKKAAGILEDLVNNKNDADLAARILQQMTSDDRGNILAVMDAEVAGVLTELLKPDTLPPLGQ
ncbi:MAG: hypothetical protein K5696_00160 [Lachnospiraceae bacterium]|nr:hypothetical protein [Lachnospiraceae bacterium]